MTHRCLAKPFWLAIGSLWALSAPSVSSAQEPTNCEQLGSIRQPILISGQASVDVLPFMGNGGQGFVCYNPDGSCYVARATSPYSSVIPFTVRQNANGLGIQSIPSCGGQTSTLPADNDFSVALSPTSGSPAGCLNQLSVMSGKLEDGFLMEDPMTMLPAVQLAGLPFLLPLPVSGNFLQVPGYHNSQFFMVNIPLVGGAISVVNGATSGPLLDGTVMNVCGATVTGGPPPGAIPTLGRWSLVALSLALLIATAGGTRRRLRV